MTIADRIIAAIKAGAVTSAQISAVIRAKQQTVAVHLCDMANNGRIVRLGSSPRDDSGRSFVLWGLPGGAVSEGEASHTSKFLAVMLMEERQLVERLAAVRAVIAAYSPREGSEFLSQTASDAGTAGAEAACNPDAGSGAEAGEPALIQDSKRTDTPFRGAVQRKAPDAGPGREIAPATDTKAKGHEPAVSKPLAAAAPPVRELPPPPSKAAPEPSATTRAPSKCASEGIKRAALALAGATQVIQDARVSRKAAAPGGDGLRVFRASELGRGVVSYRRADPPAEQRGCVNVTAALAGDPPPGRSALDQRRAAE